MGPFPQLATRIMEISPNKAVTSEIHEYLSVFWRRKWIIILSVLMVTSVAVLYALMYATPQYQSSADVLQRRTGLDKVFLGSDLFAEPSYQPERGLQTSAELVKSPEVTDAVREKLGNEFDGRDLSTMIEVSPVKQTDIIRITATDSDPQTAALVANTYAAEYMNWRQSADQAVLRQAQTPIEAQLAAMPEEERRSNAAQILREKLESLRIIETVQASTLEVVKEATPAQVPFSPRPLRMGIIAFLSSLLLGVSVALLVDRFDNRVRTMDEIMSHTGEKPVLASVPKPPSSTNGSLVTLTDPTGLCSEAYRLLKTNLGYVEPDSDIRSILFTSADAGDGKTTTIANLAVTMARSGKRVIVLEADLRRPVLSYYMGLSMKTGLTNAIADKCPLKDVLQIVDAEHLVISVDDTAGDMADQKVIVSSNGVKPIYFATCGPLPPNPGEMAASEKLGSLISEARQYADIVLVDSPALGAVGDAASMASRVDGVVFVVKMAKTPKKSLETLRRNFMDTIPSKLLGVVITNATKPVRRNDSYYYYSR